MKLEDPIHLLKEEHATTLAELERMELALADLNGARRGQALQKSLKFLDTVVRAHGEREEQLLYPVLGRHVPRQTVDVMLEEHKELWWGMDLLETTLRRPDPPHQEVRWHAIALIDLLRRHIDKENNVIFLMTAQMLSEQEYRDLAEALTKMHEAAREQ